MTPEKLERRIWNVVAGIMAVATIILVVYTSYTILSMAFA